MDKKMSKKGQVAIWVILGVVLVAAVLLYFLSERGIFTGTKDLSNPEPFIEQCAKDAVYETVDKILPQGGFVNPIGYKLYDNTNISYLCYNVGSYYPCINQHPAFLNELKKEIKNYTIKRIEDCFNQFKNEAGKRNEQVTFGEMNYSIGLAPDRIFVVIERETEITNKEKSIRIEKYEYEISSPLYNLASVAIDIATSNAKYCYFEYNGYTILYPRYTIKVDTMSDSTKIYKIEDTVTGKKMNIAIRGCAVPPGGI